MSNKHNKELKSSRNCNSCKYNNSEESREKLAINLVKEAIDNVQLGKKSRINAIWLEVSGCFGEIISLLNAQEPDVIHLLSEFVNLRFLGSISGDEGEEGYERILATLDTEYVFLVCGAVPLKDNGLYTTVATYKGRKITAMEAVETIAKNAKYIISVGTCACYGGPTAAKPNLSEAVSIPEFLKKNNVIRIPGCPTNPVWTMGVLGYITSYGFPELDVEGRPKSYYGELIHDNCARRGFFDAGIFAEKFGEEECMFALGCRGPITYAYCPISRWNGSDNWPIGDNTTCIGCAGPKFPDGTEPFVKYGGF